MVIMIKNFFQAAWEVMMDIAEARQKSIQKNNYNMWY
jgi:hypothetical protein